VHVPGSAFEPTRDRIMQSTNEPRAFTQVEGRSWRKAGPWAAGALVGVGLLLGGVSEAQATKRPVWPVGQCVDGKLMAGEGFRILQGYNVDNTFVGRCAPTASGGLGLACKHGGIDIKLESDTTTLSVGVPVLAMADGEVLDVISWGDEGVGVLVEHEDGSVAHYVHLESSHVERGQPVRQGQPLGAIMDYPYGGPGNDHLHLELRQPSLTVKTCANAGATADCDMPSDFHHECKGNGYALDAASSQTVDANAYDFVDPSSALREAELPDLSELWTRPAAAPLLDLRFLVGESGSVRNFGAGGGSASGSVTIERPYRELPEGFCDQVGRGSLSYAGSEDTSFSGGVVLDLELLLDPIASEEYLDVVRGGDDEHTSWRLAVRKNAETGRRELAFQVALEQQDEEAAEGAAYVVSEIVGQLPEPECRAIAAVASCPSGVASEPSACALPETCDPSLVEPHCMSDLGYRQWRHVVASYDDQAGTFQLLLDGEELARGLVGGELRPPEGTFTVYVGEGAVGAMDDVRVWALFGAEDEKSDDVHGFGNAPRGAQDDGCACQASATSTGAGGSLLLLLGLWGLRRRRGA
jgi:MYXO-CTERM domain-containing protein